MIVYYTYAGKREFEVSAEAINGRSCTNRLCSEIKQEIKERMARQLWSMTIKKHSTAFDHDFLLHAVLVRSISSTHF